MLVREILKDYEGEYIKLGGAVGFIFCSKVDKDTTNLVAQASEQELETYERTLRDAKNRKENFKERWEKRTANAIKQHKAWKKNGADTKYKSIKELRKAHAELKRKEKKRNNSEIPSYTKKIKDFKPILDRQVRDVYTSTVDDSTIILFEGDTVGQYWDREEYETGVLGVNKRVRHDAVQRAALRGLKY